MLDTCGCNFCIFGFLMLSRESFLFGSFGFEASRKELWSNEGDRDTCQPCHAVHYPGATSLELYTFVLFILMLLSAAKWIPLAEVKKSREDKAFNASKSMRQAINVVHISIQSFHVDSSHWIRAGGWLENHYEALTLGSSLSIPGINCFIVILN